MVYAKEFIQIINDWQAKGVGLNKSVIIDKMQKFLPDIDPKFRTISKPCFRRVDLSGKHALVLGNYFKLNEHYSSWTFDISVAENFNDGVSDPFENKTSVIFKLDTFPIKNCEVVLNLYELLQDYDFQSAVEAYKGAIKDYNSGMGFYGNNEQEIILNISKLNINQLYAYGGFSSSKENIAKQFFKHTPDKEELAFFDNLVKERKVKIGGAWVKGAGKDRILKAHIENAKRLSK